MSSSTQAEPSSISGADETVSVCVALFREAADIETSPGAAGLSDAEVLARPISSFDIDSLSTLEFVMAVEDRFAVELDEAAVNRCKTLEDLCGLVRKARNA